MTYYSDREAQTVKLLAVRGFTRSLIAKRLGISEHELVYRYGRELKIAGPEADAMVAGNLIRAALGGNLGAICFVLKIRAGWSETAFREHAEKPPLPPNISADTMRRVLVLAGIRSALENLRAEASRRGLDPNFKRPKVIKSKLMARFARSSEVGAS